jgi:hypothetical protein
MRRRRTNWSKFATDAVKLGVTANMVIAMRVAKIALGGARARSESKLMVAEKVKAATQANIAAAADILTGRAYKSPARTLALYQKKVSSNLRRLSKPK